MPRFSPDKLLQIAKASVESVVALPVSEIQPVLLLDTGQVIDLQPSLFSSRESRKYLIEEVLPGLLRTHKPLAGALITHVWELPPALLNAPYELIERSQPDEGVMVQLLHPTRSDCLFASLRKKDGGGLPLILGEWISLTDHHESPVVSAAHSLQEVMRSL